MRYRLEIETQAMQEFLAFLEYAKFQPAAICFVEEIMRRTSILQQFPYLGREAETVDGIDFRVLLVKQWRVVYFLKKSTRTIYVTNFLHPLRKLHIDLYRPR